VARRRPPPPRLVYPRALGLRSGHSNDRGEVMPRPPFPASSPVSALPAALLALLLAVFTATSCGDEPSSPGGPLPDTDASDADLDGAELSDVDPDALGDAPLDAPGDLPGDGETDALAPDTDARLGDGDFGLTDADLGLTDADGGSSGECGETLANPLLDTPLAATTAGGRDDQDNSCGGDGAADLAFSMRIAVDGTYRFGTTGAAFDPIVAVYSGVCGPTELGCDAPDAGDPEVELTLRAGDIVTVVVDGQVSGVSGDFSLTIEADLRSTETGRCLDGRDNDGDGRADCADADCAAEPVCSPFEVDCANESDDDDDGAIDCADSDCCAARACAAEPVCLAIPPAPADIAPALPAGEVVSFAESIDFLYTAETPVQRGVLPGAIDPARAAVVRGTVLGPDGPLAGVRVDVVGRTAFGATVTRDDGAYDLVLNGGRPVTLRFSLADYVPAQRTFTPPAGAFTDLPAVLLAPYDEAVTTVTSGAEAGQTARSTEVSDVRGARRTTLDVPPGVTASLVRATGAPTPLASVDVRATELTVGPDGPSRLPATLPPLSVYAYAVELSADQAVAAGDDATVSFSAPAYLWVENYLGFIDGSAVPAGRYDRRAGHWVARDNGRIVRIVGETAELADLDVDGDSVADIDDELTALGIDDAERRELAALYDPGQRLWRTPISELGTWAHAWPYSLNFPTPINRTHEPRPGEPEPYEALGGVADPRVELQTRTLQQRVPVAGTGFDLVYRSDRVDDRSIARALTVPGGPPSSGVVRVATSVEVAGQRTQRTEVPPAIQQIDFAWDGLDGFGRPVFGARDATVRVGYGYQPPWISVPASFERAFGRPRPRGVAVTSSIMGQGDTFVFREHQWPVRLQPESASPFGLGGWSLDVQRFYDATQGVLYEGDGTRRTARTMPLVVETFVGGAGTGFGGDGGPARDARVDSPRGMAIGPDGAFYFADAANRRVRRVDAAGDIATVAGTGDDPAFDASLLGDGGPALEAALGTPMHVAFGPDDALYIACLDGRVRRVGAAGTIETVAGGGELVDAEAEGALATEVALTGLWDIAFAPDGAYYVAEAASRTVRHVGTDGRIMTAAGGGSESPLTNTVQATDVGFGAVSGIAVLPTGELLIADNTARVVVRVVVDGRITPFAGTGAAGHSGDGGPAAAAAVTASGLSVGGDGSVYLAGGGYIRRVRSTGIIETLAGTGVAGQGPDGAIATATDLFAPTKVLVGPDGVVYFDDGVNGPNERVRALRPALPARSGDDELLVPSGSGREVYVFAPTGRHLRTLHGETGETLYGFEYDDAGLLVAIVDAAGNETTIERDGAGAPTAIVAPFGQRTALRRDANGYVDQITDPSGAAYTMAFSEGGLLQGLTDPRRGSHAFVHSEGGLLESLEGPEGRALTLVSETIAPFATRVTATTGLGEATQTEVSTDVLGGRTQLVRFPGGGTVQHARAASGVVTVTHRDGSTATSSPVADPRLGAAAALEAAAAWVTPGGVRDDGASTPAVEDADRDDPFDYDRLVDERTVAGGLLVAELEAATRTRTTTTPEGRIYTLVEDEAGRPLRAQLGDDLPITFEYDEVGRQVAREQGDRRTEVRYGDDGAVEALVDALGRETTFTTDELGRPTSVTWPGARALALRYDEHGNITRFTPPSSDAYDVEWDGQDLLARVDPPDAVPGVDEFTTETRDADGRLTQVVRAAEGAVTVGYSSGRYRSVAGTVDTRQLDYDGAGLLATNTRLGAVSTTIGRDGPLVTSESWSTTGTVAVTWAAGMRPVSERAEDTTVAYEYDGDGLLVRAGALTLRRDELTGRVVETRLDGVETATTYDGYGQVTAYRATYEGSTLFAATYEYDDLGRLEEVAETTEGATRRRAYTYDDADRVATVREGGVLTLDIDWDANGNRERVSGPEGALFDAVFDARDRITRQGTTSFTWASAGGLASRTRDGLTTTFTVDEQGWLRSVTLPDTSAITYVVDASGRRVVRSGAATERLVYDAAGRLVAWASPAGTSRFVYAGRNVPEYFTRAGRTYAIVADHLGSPRLVVETTTGAVEQRLDYDVFGAPIRDTSPGFQPFAFAAGIWDPQTELVHFGGRDYDPATSRWIAPAPGGLRPGATNLYSYAAGNPQGLVDPTGLQPIPARAVSGGWGSPGGLFEAAQARVLRGVPNAAPERLSLVAHPDLHALREALLAPSCAFGETCVPEPPGLDPLVANRYVDVAGWVVRTFGGDALLLAEPDATFAPAQAGPLLPAPVSAGLALE
jgi:RHS repeat-associated protein